MIGEQERKEQLEELRRIDAAAEKLRLDLRRLDERRDELTLMLSVRALAGRTGEALYSVSVSANPYNAYVALYVRVEGAASSDLCGVDPLPDGERETANWVYGSEGTFADCLRAWAPGTGSVTLYEYTMERVGALRRLLSLGHVEVMQSYVDLLELKINDLQVTLNRSAR